MNRFSFKFLGWAVVASVLFFSCEKTEEGGEELVPQKTVKCLVVNQGNYSDANGGISVLYSDGSLVNQAYQNANGEPLAAIVESAVDCGNTWALMCANEDKIEFLDKNTFKSVAVVKGISTPRYGAVVGNALYVTSSDFYNLSTNGLYKIDLSTYKQTDYYPLEGTPEGVIYYDDCLWVASALYNAETWASYDPYVCRFQLKNDMKKDVYKLEGSTMAARHLAVDKNGTIWASLSAYGMDGQLVQVDTTERKLDNEITLAQLNYPGHIYASSTGDQIYYMTTDGYSAGGAEEITTIKTIDVTSKSITTVVSGNGFYGFGVDGTTGDIYTANVNGFQTNATMYIYTSTGEQKNEGDLVGVGACRFLFPK